MQMLMMIGQASRILVREKIEERKCSLKKVPTIWKDQNFSRLNNVCLISGRKISSSKLKAEMSLSLSRVKFVHFVGLEMKDQPLTREDMLRNCFFHFDKHLSLFSNVFVSIFQCICLNLKMCALDERLASDKAGKVEKLLFHFNMYLSFF